MDSYQPAIFAYWGSKVSSKLHAFHFHLTIPNQLVCMYGSIIPGLQVDKLPAFHYMAHQWDLWYKRRTVHLDPMDQHFFWVCEFLVKLQTWLFQCTCSDSQVSSALDGFVLVSFFDKIWSWHNFIDSLPTSWSLYEMNRHQFTNNIKQLQSSVV